ncbi:MAG: transposase [Caldilineaceae bacterium]|nr:transposase [Caldilineaceae bacterium]
MRGYSSEQWAEWIAAQRPSGLSVVDFCESVGVSQNSFYAWRRKLATDDDALPEFVALSIPDAAGVPRVEVELPCGAVVRLPCDDGPLRQVLGVLLEFGARQEASSC